jgi:energy-coupling factor transporter ATP-binding protein EcfA2
VKPHYLVGFTGRSGSGKTTIAEAVQRLLHDRRAAPMKFADPLVAMLGAIGIRKGGHPQFRTLAQIIGQRIRDHDPDFFVDLLLADVSALTFPRVALIDDVRYANEAAACDLVVKLVTTRDCGLTAEQMLHRSEREWELVPAQMQYITDDPHDIDAIAGAVAQRILSATANQCDGCQRGVPVDDKGIHRGDGIPDMQICTSHLYA